MYLRQLKDDSRGFAFSLDLLLALIPITIILGMAAANMDSMYYLTQETTFQTSLDRVGADTVKSLLETSGQPYDWQTLGNPYSPGLATYDSRAKAPIPNYIDPAKLGALNTTLMQEMVGSPYGYYINITTVNNNSQYYSLGTYNGSASNIVRIERLVRLSKFTIVSQGVGIRYNKQPRDYSNPPNPFQTNIAYNNAYDYYVLVYNKDITSASVEINNIAVVRQNDFQGGTTFIRKKIDPAVYGSTILKNATQLQDNSVVLKQVASKPGSNLDVYIIRVPKGTPENLIDLEGTKPIAGRFVFYIWIR
ncbi:hypothetical protein [Methanobacterium alcaliphilum]|uniref:hypothetical protein n=1 Tax=Methanobacterium alcaliphilum TaxID=392018 RepID=UPI00200B85F0|nr:hypothetical protein [Methanobacterium alcaliphilum]MCK9150655.1 hypothetical protein [Methanobacterium alcaliphilum]